MRHSQPAAVLDEAQFPEFVHEEIDLGARCPVHSRQSLLRQFGNHYLRMVLHAITREQQSARQPFLAGVKEPIDQVLLDSDVSGADIFRDLAALDGWMGSSRQLSETETAFETGLVATKV